MVAPPEVSAILEAELPAPVEPLTLTAALRKREDAATLPVPCRPETGADSKPVVALDTLSCLVPEGDADALALRLQPLLAPCGWQALRTTASYKDFFDLFGMDYANALDKYNNAAVLVFFPAEDDTPLLWARGTSGPDFDAYTEDIAESLAWWREEAGASLVGAGCDWVDVRFDRLPEDIEGFAEGISTLCPDTLNLGREENAPDGEEEDEDEDWDEDDEEEAIAGLAAYLRREKRVFLWWD